ncbi:MAG: hypothetical protein GF418_14450 [Chitinivibrionales bacterium]|nr:hypothetical protein [Chitinivibrionales bacterium]MBD3396821.1 hypothetical protein [Chitinivibrionales bacterium]
MRSTLLNTFSKVSIEDSPKHSRFSGATILSLPRYLSRCCSRRSTSGAHKGRLNGCAAGRRMFDGPCMRCWSLPLSTCGRSTTPVSSTCNSSVTMTTFAVKTSVFCILILSAQVVISLDWELSRNLETGRITGAHVGWPKPYEPSQEVLAVQRHQREHPTLGFLWEPDIDTSDDVVVAWGDIPAGALTTDEYGFANTPSAITMRRDSVPVDIIGLGASYIGGAQGLFHEYCALKGYFYYNLAHGRFTLPQYNLALKDPGLSLNPRWAVYAVNEVSFVLIPDFEKWQATNMGWFDFHSGTWCGPARETGFPHDILRQWPRVHDTYRSVMQSLFRNKLPGKTLSRAKLMDKTFAYIQDAQAMAAQYNVNFVVLLIPSRNRMIHGPSPALYMFEELVPRVKEARIPFIDLRENYRTAEDPAQLYFKQDAHWNSVGVYRAVREVLAYIETNSSGNAKAME